jgi:hypothetical protein
MYKTRQPIIHVHIQDKHHLTSGGNKHYLFNGTLRASGMWGSGVSHPPSKTGLKTLIPFKWARKDGQADSQHGLTPNRGTSEILSAHLYYLIDSWNEPNATGISLPLSVTAATIYSRDLVVGLSTTPTSVVDGSSLSVSRRGFQRRHPRS